MNDETPQVSSTTDHGIQITRPTVANQEQLPKMARTPNTERTEFFGDLISKKEENVLSAGFSNIGGLKAEINNHTDDLLQSGFTALDFDVIGWAETNLDWRMIPEQHKLYSRLNDWWETTHISFAHNCTSPPKRRQQWEGTALISNNKAAHRIIGIGFDSSHLGRWCWTRYQGKNNRTL